MDDTSQDTSRFYSIYSISTVLEDTGHHQAQVVLQMVPVLMDLDYLMGATEASCIVVVRRHHGRHFTGQVAFTAFQRNNGRYWTSPGTRGAADGTYI